MPKITLLTDWFTGESGLTILKRKKTKSYPLHWHEYFEIEYFNTGKEWRLEDEEGDDFGNVYTHEWKDDERKREIAENIGVDPGEVTLYLFDGWTKTAKYKEA